MMLTLGHSLVISAAKVDYFRKSLELQNDTIGKHEYNLKNLNPSRRQLLDRSDVHYVEDVEKLGQDSSKGTPEESPRDSPLLNFSQEKPNNENETLADEASFEGSSPGHPEEPVVEATKVKGIEKEAGDSDEVFIGMHAKGEDKWKLVQRPRASGAYGG
ncbi:hypothetical protein Droror1_Dr00012054 [Drosera rotundifolia]